MRLSRCFSRKGRRLEEVMADWSARGVVSSVQVSLHPADNFLVIAEWLNDSTRTTT